MISKKYKFIARTMVGKWLSLYWSRRGQMRIIDVAFPRFDANWLVQVALGISGNH
jgi:hypothetical protein